MAYIDLAEVPTLRTKLKLLGSRRWHPLAFLEDDHRFAEGSLEDEIRGLVGKRDWQTVDRFYPPLDALAHVGLLFQPP